MGQTLSTKEMEVFLMPGLQAGSCWVLMAGPKSRVPLGPQGNPGALKGAGLVHASSVPTGPCTSAASGQLIHGLRRWPLSPAASPEKLSHHSIVYAYCLSFPCQRGCHTSITHPPQTGKAEMKQMQVSYPLGQGCTRTGMWNFRPYFLDAS